MTRYRDRGVHIFVGHWLIDYTVSATSIKGSDRSGYNVDRNLDMQETYRRDSQRNESMSNGWTWARYYRDLKGIPRGEARHGRFVYREINEWMTFFYDSPGERRIRRQ